MVTRCLALWFRRWLLFCSTSVALFLTLPLLLTDLCSVWSFALFFLSFLLTLCFAISSAPSAWSVLFPLLVFRLGIFLLCSLFSGVLPLSPSLLAIFVTLPGRSSFLLSLATARRVGELQALSSQVSSSGDDLFLSYLPEFRAKTESSVRPLLRSFPVGSLRDFVGSLPDELLLCPVRALRLYLSHTASLPSRPRSLFVSPRAPSHSLSKNALSFFIREVIAEAYSSAGRSLLQLLVLGLRFVRMVFGGVAASWAFHRSAPLSSILESATWSSPSVFSCFYLSDVQFSSSSGYGLGSVVAAGSVV